MKQIFFATEETLLTTGYYGVAKYENDEIIILDDRYTLLMIQKMLHINTMKN